MVMDHDECTCYDRELNSGTETSDKQPPKSNTGSGTRTRSEHSSTYCLGPCFEGDPAAISTPAVSQQPQSSLDDMARDPTIIDFRNRMLKLESAAEVEELFKDLQLDEVEELIFTGNTIGVGGGEGLGKVLRQMTSLKVCLNHKSN